MYAVDGKDELSQFGFIFKEYASDPEKTSYVTDSPIARSNGI